MTQDEIIEMAGQADAYADAMDIGGKNYIGLRDKYFAKLVAAKEREACAKIADEYVGQDLGHNFSALVAHNIRARGEA
jgi:hypothetical protein